MGSRINHMISKTDAEKTFGKMHPVRSPEETRMEGISQHDYMLGE